MQVTDSQGKVWSIDEGLRERARLIKDQFPGHIGHVDLDQIIFIRLSNAYKDKWHGKCYFIGRNPFPIISKFVCYKLQSFGMLNLENTSSIDGDIFDLRFVIAINEDRISAQSGDIQRIEDIVLLHEMMHIKESLDGLEKHDIEDFKALLDEFGTGWANGQFKDEDEDFVPVSGGLESWNSPESD